MQLPTCLLTKSTLYCTLPVVLHNLLLPVVLVVITHTHYRSSDPDAGRYTSDQHVGSSATSNKPSGFNSAAAAGAAAAALIPGAAVAAGATAASKSRDGKSVPAVDTAAGQTADASAGRTADSPKHASGSAAAAAAAVAGGAAAAGAAAASSGKKERKGAGIRLGPSGSTATWGSPTDGLSSDDEKQTAATAATATTTKSTSSGLKFRPPWRPSGKATIPPLEPTPKLSAAAVGAGAVGAGAAAARPSTASSSGAAAGAGDAPNLSSIQSEGGSSASGSATAPHRPMVTPVRLPLAAMAAGGAAAGGAAAAAGAAASGSRGHARGYSDLPATPKSPTADEMRVSCFVFPQLVGSWFLHSPTFRHTHLTLIHNSAALICCCCCCLLIPCLSPCLSP